MNDQARETGEGAPGSEAIRQQLERILASPQFAHAPSMERMLRFVVGHALGGTADRLKEYTLGVEVFGRGDDFDPRQDTIVRVQARRLRERLAEYYREQGATDPVAIDMPTGHYVPTFRLRDAPPTSATANEHPVRKPRRWAGVAMLALVVLISLGIGAAFHGMRQRLAEQTGNTRVRIAVLPFTDMSPNQDHEYLADGLTEELIHRLVQSPSLQVTARTSAFAFKGRAGDVRSIGRTLGVDRVIEGSVRQDGERLRVTVQLIDALTDAHLWSQTYDRRADDLFKLQSEIAEAAATTLRTTLRHGPAPPKPEAYALYLRGRFHYNRQAEGDTDRAEAMFRQAIAADSRFAPAWAGLAGVLLGKTYGGKLPWDSGTRQAGEAVRRALELDPDLVEARLRLASYLYWAEGDQDRTAAELHRAWRLEPDNPLVLTTAAGLAYSQQQSGPAIALLRRALERDPLVYNCGLSLAATLAEEGQFDASESEIRRLVALYPEPRPELELVRARLRILQRRPDEANRLLEPLPATTTRSHLMALAHAGAGDVQQSEALLKKLLLPPKPGESCHPHPAVTRAEAWMLRDKPERALAELLSEPGPDIGTAVGRYDYYTLNHARTSLLLRPLQSDRRWQDWSRKALDVRKPVDLSLILASLEPGG